MSIMASISIIYHAGVERVHHANDDVVNVASRQLLSERLQRGGGERRRTRAHRLHPFFVCCEYRSLWTIGWY